MLPLLVTDVVDSTRLAETLGDEATAALWERHDRVARDLLVPHGGREIDKTDGFLLVFASADDALAYAAAYHQALAPLGLSARVGLHVGPVILRSNTASDVARGAKPLEVEGLAKPTAARVMSLARGGQTLVTADARAALGPSDLAVRSQGLWRLKGLSEPIELFQVGPAGADFTPPSDAVKAWRVVARGDLWLPVREVPHALPAERDAFVGRGDDLLALEDRLDAGGRLVSVLGVGGTGKTRFAVRFGWTRLGDFQGGVWFVDVSEARDLDGILSAAAAALGVPLSKGDRVAQLGHAIAARDDCLLLLDNFEQVARHAPDTVGVWLDLAPRARFVVTTREVLGLPGESALALAPLVPAEGVELFTARARQARRDHDPVAERPHVEALVALLDGLPLAIELAAARIRVMSPRLMLDRMSERFRLLTSSGGRHTRQATLRATLDWSWDLLSEPERLALARLSVFEGGFSLPAADAVLDLPDLWTPDALQALVDKSLLRPATDDRFDMLVTVAEYAAEKLDQQGGRADAERRHGAWYARSGAEAFVDALDGEQGPALRFALNAEFDNLVAACRRAVARADGDVATATLAATWEVVRLRGPPALALELAADVGRLDLPAAHRARVDVVAGLASRFAGRGAEGIASLEAALRHARETGDRRSEGRILSHLGGSLQQVGRLREALEVSESALPVLRELGDHTWIGRVCASLGMTLDGLGRYEQARARLVEALGIHRQTHDGRGQADALTSLGVVEDNLGNLDEARRAYDGALEVLRRLRNVHGEATALSNVGIVLHQQGELERALEVGEAALALDLANGWVRGAAISRCNLGLVHRDRGHPDQAEACFRRAREDAIATQNEVSIGVAEGNLGNLLRATDRPEEARTLLEAALARHRAVGFTYGTPYWLGGLALLAADGGARDAALDLAREAVAVAAPVPLVHGEALSALARVHLARGEVELAAAALEVARGLGLRGVAASLLAAVEARVAAARGDREGMEAALARVHPAFCAPQTEVGRLVAATRG